MADISQVNLPNDNNNPYNIADTTARSGLADKMDKTNPTGTGNFSLNRKANTTIGGNSFAEGYNTTASGYGSHAEGSGTTASGRNAHAEGTSTTASDDSDHAEGSGTTASGGISHAEGVSTTASGFGSHTEGYHTTASNAYSHAEGYYSIASGDYSHVEGWDATANHRSQHVFGEYNVLDDSTAAATARGNYVEIVGNGIANNIRSNARTLDWSGNEVLSGTIEATGFGTTLDKEVDRGGVQLTQAQYDALVNAGTVDANTTYFIIDANNTTASYAAGVTYDNTNSGMTATNVQAAIDEMVDDGFYHVGDTISLLRTGMVAYSGTSNFYFTIPLDKPIGNDVTSISLTGSWRCILTDSTTLAQSVYMNDVSLDSLGTVTCSMAASGVQVSVVLSSALAHWSLGTIVGRGSNILTFS